MAAAGARGEEVVEANSLATTHPPTTVGGWWPAQPWPDGAIFRAERDKPQGGLSSRYKMAGPRLAGGGLVWQLRLPDWARPSAATTDGGCPDRNRTTDAATGNGGHGPPGPAGAPKGVPAKGRNGWPPWRPPRGLAEGYGDPEESWRGGVGDPDDDLRAGSGPLRRRDGGAGAAPLPVEGAAGAAVGDGSAGGRRAVPSSRS